MKGFSKQIILTISLLLYVVRVSAQGVSSFPVQVSAQITSPSVYLSDYVSGFEDRATVVLVNRDVMSTGIDVRLRMTIKCQNGLTLRTKPSAVFEAVTLYPGMSERLGAAELSQYFELRNLDVTGTMFQGTMPEGLATFTFEAVEYHTGVVVSTPYTTVTNLTINKPPALLYPKNGIVMRPLSARSFQLQWQPRHSYSGAGVMYEITIKEIADTLSNLMSAYNYSQTIYQTETASTSLTYSLSEPELEEGKRYGWCVRAYSVEGTVHFTNGGYSEVFTFDVRHPDGYDVHDTVTVKRKEDRDPFDKSPERISRCGEDSYTVTDLTPAEHLEVGDTITVGGGFKVVVTSLTQSGSTFSGEGYMFIPYIGVDFTVDIRNIQVNASRQLISGYTEVRCDMSGSQIGGTDMLLQGGGKRLKNGVVLPDLSVGFLLTDVSGAEYDSVTGTLTLKDENGSVIGTIETPRNEQGEPVFPIRVKDNDGNLVQIEEETDTDSRPTGRYKFTPLGRQTGKYISESQLSGIRGDLGTVTFEKDDSGVFTFDSPLKYYETVALLLNSDGANGGGRIYRRMSNCDQYYDVPWLFIGEGCTEQVRARLKLTGSGKKEIPKPEDIQFIVSDEGGVTVLPSTYNADGTYSVTVAASQADSRQTVHAVYMVGDRCYQLGMLDVDTRAPMRDSVCLVNLGGSYSASQIETELNTIYGRVGVTWNVTEEDGFSYPKDSIAHLFDSKSKALELYNSHQKNLNRAFETYLGDRYDGKTCYLFMMPANGSGSKRELAGFMPRGEQYGYINTDVILQEQMPAVIAHELGHGKFRLRHTFDSEYGKGAESKKGKTDNLMDYAPTPSRATHIAKWQWNQIHNPALLTELWERDEDSEWTTDGHYYLFTYLGMLMGLDYDTAEQYGRWAEEPDTHVVTDEDISNGTVVMGNNVTVHLPDSVKKGDMLENTTWLIGGMQQRYHALTGGLHGVELAATAYALTHAAELGMEDDVKRYLLHRFGDCFAHFDISNDAKGFDDVPLKSYVEAIDNFIKDKVKYVSPNTNITVGFTMPSNSICEFEDIFYSSLTPNETVKRIVTGIINSGSTIRKVKDLLYQVPQIYDTFDYKKEFFTRNELIELILPYLPPAVQNNYVMYGDNVERCVAFTLGHALEGGEPDEIIRRSELFKMYTKRICELFKLMNLVGGNADVEEAAKSVNVIVDWCCQKLDKNARLDGIFAAHIAALRRNIPFNIPIKILPNELNTGLSKYYYVYRRSKDKKDFTTDKLDQEKVLNLYLDENKMIKNIDCN